MWPLPLCVDFNLEFLRTSSICGIVCDHSYISSHISSWLIFSPINQFCKSKKLVFPCISDLWNSFPPLIYNIFNMSRRYLTPFTSILLMRTFQFLPHVSNSGTVHHRRSHPFLHPTTHDERSC